MAWIALLVAGLAMNAAAQGSFLPATYASDPNFDHSGGTVYYRPGVLVYGNGYQAQYYIGPAGTTDPSALVAVGPQAGFLGSSSTDIAGGAGYWEGNGNAAITTSFAGGSQVVLQLRAWSGNSSVTYASAQVKAASSLITMTLGNAGSPPTPATSVTGLQNFTIFLGPEPATIFLGLLGAGAFLIRGRK